jgi:hypothetical protein
MALSVIDVRHIAAFWFIRILGRTNWHKIPERQKNQMRMWEDLTWLGHGGVYQGSNCWKGNAKLDLTRKHTKNKTVQEPITDFRAQNHKG